MFWDAISFPNVNLYANLSFHQALVGMLYLEEMAEACGVKVPAVTVLGKDMKTVVRYEETAESLRHRLEETFGPAKVRTVQGIASFVCRKAKEKYP